MTVNRVLKRLARDTHITAIPQPRENQYIYMPNPTLIHPRSTHIEHWMAIADFYIHAKYPQTFVIEPSLNGHSYRPDIYYKDEKGKSYIVEIQRSRISNKDMQQKVNNFVDSYFKRAHDATTFTLVTDMNFKLTIHEGFTLETISFSQLKEVSAYA